MALCTKLLSPALLAFATPSWGQVTLPLEPMSSVQLKAVEDATAMVGAMPKGILRDQASTFIAYRLMTRGDCQRALPILNQYLVSVEDLTALGGLATGALTGRDPRCMAWLAARIDAALSTGSLSEDRRAELRLRGQTMFMLVGQLTRSDRMPAADSGMLDEIPESLKHREVALEGLTLQISMADAPTRRETLLIDRLWDYRGTPLQLRLARSLENRAIAEPKFLSEAGWIEVALVLLGAGDRTSAEKLLARTGVRHMSGAGLEAEVALRQNDAKRAVAIFAANDWGTKTKSVYRLIDSWPDVLVPYIEGPKIFGSGLDAKLELVSLSEALDRAGYPASAERAARAATKSSETVRYGRNRIAQAFARLGEFNSAGQILLDANKLPQEVDPGQVRLRIAMGAAFAGNLAETLRAINAAPAGQRDWILIETLAAVSQIPSSVRDDLERRLVLRAGQDKRLNVSRDAMARFARGGLHPPLLTSLLGRLEPGRENARLATLMAELARESGHRESALATAEMAETLLPDGPQADAELVSLTELYWKLALPQKATLLASQVSHPVGKIDALTRAFNPSRGESKPKLSFVMFR